MCELYLWVQLFCISRATSNLFNESIGTYSNQFKGSNYNWNYWCPHVTHFWVFSYYKLFLLLVKGTWNLGENITWHSQGATNNVLKQMDGGTSIINTKRDDKWASISESGERLTTSWSGMTSKPSVWLFLLYFIRGVFFHRVFKCPSHLVFFFLHPQLSHYLWF